MRARPLAREDRRAAIISTTIPLLMVSGREVTTRQIAEAAGVAEGTIYAVFDDKDDLITACVDHVLDETPVLLALEALPTDGDLEDFVERMVELTQQRVRDVFTLISAVRFDPRTRGHHHDTRPQRLVDAIADKLLDYRDVLRMSPRRAAHVIRITAFAMTHPVLTDGEQFTPREIAETLLGGIATPLETRQTIS
jgi:AcrR family transcriptional regulator